MYGKVHQCITGSQGFHATILSPEQGVRSLHSKVHQCITGLQEFHARPLSSAESVISLYGKVQLIYKYLMPDHYHQKKV